MFAEQMESKLDGLSQSYVRLLNSAFHHRQYLNTTNPDSIRKEAAALQAELEKDPPKVQEINKKRIEILGKRVEKFDKIKENCQVVDAQCAAIEDVLQLIRDQSVTMHDPQQISEHLDNLVKDVEQTEETVREMESIFDVSPLASPDFNTDDFGSSGKTYGGRVRN
jgi:chromosome condensin MukBEF ATPase and DNA-binding subunit MukB